VHRGRSYPNVIDASDDDLRESIRNAEQRSGFTYEELAAQAESGRFESTQAKAGMGSDRRAR
jgi:hypothetical protein